MDEWYNAVQAQVCLAKYPQETANILHHDIFWFILKDEEFVSKTINDSSINLDKLLASKAQQLVKKMKASKATVQHIKQVPRGPQAAQINLIRHQWTDLPPSNNKRKAFKARPLSHKHHTSEQQVPPYKESLILSKLIQAKKGVSKCGDSRHDEGFKCPVKKYQCKSCHKYGHFTSLGFKKQVPFKSRAPKAH